MMGYKAAIDNDAFVMDLILAIDREFTVLVTPSSCYAGWAAEQVCSSPMVLHYDLTRIHSQHLFHINNSQFSLSSNTKPSSLKNEIASNKENAVSPNYTQGQSKQERIQQYSNKETKRQE